jgi:hypothetical protein
MAEKLTDISNVVTTLADGDLIYTVDISDPTDDAAGTSASITLTNFRTTMLASWTTLGAYGITDAATSAQGALADSALQAAHDVTNDHLDWTVDLGGTNIHTGNYVNTVYTHPTTAGNKHVPTAGSSGQYLKWSASGTAVWDTVTAGEVGADPIGTDNSDDNATNSQYSSLVTDSGEPATLRNGGSPTLGAGVTAGEMQTLLVVDPAGTINYSHPTSAGNKHIPTAGSADDYLKWSASGTAVWAPVVGGLTVTAEKTGNYTAANNEKVPCDTSGGAFTLTFPPTPSVGDRVAFIDVGDNFGTFNLTLGRNGVNIIGLAEDMTVDVAGANFTFIYIDATEGWFADTGVAGGLAGVQGATGAQGDAGEPKVTQNIQTGTTYTLVLTDEGKLVTMSNAAASTLTIPANASVAYDVGTRIEIAQLGAGQLTVAITSDTLNSADSYVKLAKQFTAATLTKTATTTWLLVGNLVA